jgi:hypothetical protein
MALNNRGVAWRDKGDKRKALADFKAAVALDSSLVVDKEHARQMQQQIAAAARPGNRQRPCMRCPIRPRVGPGRDTEGRRGHLARARWQAHLC